MKSSVQEEYGFIHRDSEAETPSNQKNEWKDVIEPIEYRMRLSVQLQLRRSKSMDLRFYTVQ
jgi:hypothetical protein